MSRCPRAFVSALALVFPGCVAHSPRSLTPGPEARVVLTGPPRTFSEDRCGPGSLAAVLTALGAPVSEQELDAELPKTRGGVLSLYLLLAARGRGFDAVLEAGDAVALRGEIQEGRAAIVMLRLLDAPGTRRDVYHYVVVDGFDPERQLFRFQFGDGKARWARPSEVERTWKAAGHALLRVRPRSLSLADGLRRGVELEKSGRPAEAADLYRELLATHPESLRAWVNLGNAEATRGRRSEAEAAYRAALRRAPSDRDALNNLAWLLLADEARREEAEALAARAVVGSGTDRLQAADTLGRIQLARDRCHEAAATLEEALSGEETPAPLLRAALFEGLGQARRACGEVDAAREAFSATLLAGPGPDTARAARAGLEALGPPP